jgi:four helix bundle suffix protein
MSEKKSDGLDGSDGDADGKRKKLRPSGGYRQLRSFKTTTIIYDATVSFCNRFMDKRSRTVDQMVQAARSGRQNIAEGSRAGATSSKTETHLTNVARGSLDELLLDYEDFLRQRGLRQWGKDDSSAREVRAVGRKTDPTDRSDGAAYGRWLEHKDPAVVANALICLIHQANYLLDQQIVALERQFVEGGGYSEQLAAARIAERERRRDSSDLTDRSGQQKAKLPDCPLCGKLMALRTARQGKNAGSQFWGCTGYPDCKGARKLDGSD